MRRGSMHYLRSPESRRPIMPPLISFQNFSTGLNRSDVYLGHENPTGTPCGGNECTNLTTLSTGDPAFIMDMFNYHTAANAGCAVLESRTYEYTRWNNATGVMENRTWLYSTVEGKQDCESVAKSYICMSQCHVSLLCLVFLTVKK